MANPAQAKEKKAASKRPTAQKRQKQNEKRRTANKAAKSCIRTKVRAFREDVQTLNAAQKATSINELNGLLDKAAKKGVFTVNKTSRLKSRLAVRLQKTAASA